MQLRKYLAAPFAALLLTGASLANAAAPIDVTWNPSAAGISTAGAFTFDNILLNSYAAIDITGGGTTFSEQGFVSLAGFSNNNVFTSIPTAGFPGGATLTACTFLSQLPELRPRGFLPPAALPA